MTAGEILRKRVGIVRAKSMGLLIVFETDTARRLRSANRADLFQLLGADVDLKERPPGFHRPPLTSNPDRGASCRRHPWIFGRQRLFVGPGVGQAGAA
jgi:hypothetical protein